ncbi:hypothetical protein BKA70DRAFT_1396577, partial [Coprinopsis sp. MPI-PUGE-AT-0042]
MGFNSSGYHSDDSQKPAVYHTRPMADSLTAGNMPFTEAAENDFGGPTLSARWIATHLLMTLTPVKCNPLISNLNALEDYVTDAIDPIDEVISWLRPSDQSILLALHFIERVTIKRNEVKEQRQDLFKRRQGIPPSLRALWRQLKPWCALNFDTTCGIEVALFLRRVLTLGIVLAEVMLNGRVLSILFKCRSLPREEKRHGTGDPCVAGRTRRSLVRVGCILFELAAGPQETLSSGPYCVPRSWLYGQEDREGIRRRDGGFATSIQELKRHQPTQWVTAREEPQCEHMFSLACGRRLIRLSMQLEE